MWRNFFSCKGCDKLADFKLEEALGCYDANSEDTRVNGVIKCIEDFFRYQIELATNQNYILRILESFVLDIQKSYDSLSFIRTHTPDIKRAKKRHLYSLLFASKPMGVKEFLDSVKHETQDQIVFEELV